MIWLNHLIALILPLLRRSIDDINLLAAQGANLRLCKGAYYWEGRKVAYKDHSTSFSIVFKVHGNYK